MSKGRCLRRLLIAIIAVSAFVSFPGCSDRPTDDGRKPPDFVVVPTVVTVGDHSYRAAVEPWRDLEPGDASGLLARAILIEADSMDADSNLSPTYIWIATGEQIWGAPLKEIDRPSSYRYLITAMARNGPNWPPQALVQTVIEFGDADGQRYLLRAPDTAILAAY